MTSYTVAGIDIHKKVLMVVVADAGAAEWEFIRQRFGTGASERQRLLAWLCEQGVKEVVMESTGQYWKPVWLDLEPGIERLQLAQAQSNRGPRGRKHDFGDAERLVRRLVSGELVLSYVPGAAQRGWRLLTRSQQQLSAERARVSNQIESLLEEMRIKLSSVISELLGLSGRRILAALAKGETDPQKLAELGDRRLRCSREELADALTGRVEPTHRSLLRWLLERVELLDRQLAEMEGEVAAALAPHADAVQRLAEIPGFGPAAAQRWIAEVGPEAAAFPTAKQQASWVGVCPGREETAEENKNPRSPQGNPAARRVLTQCAQAAARSKGTVFAAFFRTRMVRLGYAGAVWAVAHKLCRVAWKILHDGVQYVEHGEGPPPERQRQRLRRMVRELRRLGYTVTEPEVPVAG